MAESRPRVSMPKRSLPLTLERMMSTARLGSWLSTRRSVRMALWLARRRPCLALSTMAIVWSPASLASWMVRFAEVEDPVARI